MPLASTALPRLHAGLLALAIVCSGLSAHAAIFGVYRSTDDGRSWQKVGRGLPSDLRIEALGRSGDRRLAGTERGIYLSSDDGETWTRPLHGVPENLKVFDFARHENRLYAATARGLWASADHGDSWAPVDGELAATRVLSLVVNADTLFAGTDGQGIFALGHGDAPGETLGAGLPARAQIFQFAVRHGVVFAALYARGVYRYEPATRKWISAGDERPLRLVVFDGRLFAGRNPGGVFTSAHGDAEWVETSRGLPLNAPTWTLASTPTTVLIGTAGHSGLMRFDASTAAWTPSDHGLPRDGAAIAFGVHEKSILAAVFSAP